MDEYLNNDLHRPSPGPGLLYRIVTKYWPRVATGVVATGALAGWIIDALALRGALEFYVFAWGATTAGVWFLFDRAEAAVSDDTRKQIVVWLKERTLRTALESIPRQFVTLFDRVYGDRHLSLRCLFRSLLTSAIIAVIVLSVILGTRQGLWETLWSPVGPPTSIEEVATATDGVPLVDDIRSEDIQPTSQSSDSQRILGLPFSLSLYSLDRSLPHRGLVVLSFIVMWALLSGLPDYVSLLETRWAIGRASGSAGIIVIVVFDLVITSGISLCSILLYGALWANLGPADIPRVLSGYHTASPFFYSAFFTSFWLWCYILAWAVSRALVRASSGMGFLLRLTDLEEQPFRSIGFVSVVSVTVAFILGGLVLLI